MVLILNVVSSNPILATVNTVKSGAKLASKAVKSGVFQKVKKGGEHIRGALKAKKDAEDIWEKIQNFFNSGMNLNHNLLGCSNVYENSNIVDMCFNSNQSQIQF